jgi:hypothetical protein
MRRRLAAAVCCGFLLAGCGADAGFSDGRIADAIEAENDRVGGDPFCVVSDYLNDADEVEQADEKGNPIIASRRGNIGVAVEPPFPPDCENRVQKGLDRLDREEK